MVHARFDDLRPGGRGFSLHGLEEVLATDAPSGVPDVLDAAEAAVSAGRWVAGWVAYEAAPVFDPALVVHPDVAGAGLPLAWFGVFSDRRAGPGGDHDRSHRVGPWAATTGAARHMANVEEIRRRIRAGDVYQVNQTFQMVAPFEGSTMSLYADLCAAQRAGYAAHIDAGRWSIVSVSPEAFFEWEDGVIRSRPMKGTAKRGRDLAEDALARDRLRSSAKERAENVMITDMVRNDLGRLATVGSVEVPRLLAAERYETVWQLTSTVEARPLPGTTLRDVFAAMFPGASITGAPKAAAMQIIAELEDGPRGVYTGAIGFGGPGTDGRAAWAFNVGIRTVLVDRAEGTARYGTGGGITYDSDPTAEHDEALLKAEVLFRPNEPFGLVETLRWTPEDGFHRLDAHVRRLADSAAFFGMPLDPRATRSKLLQVVEDGSDPVRVRLELRPDGTTVTIHPLPDPSEQPRVMVDHVGVDPSDPFLRHKTTRRTIYEQAAARHPDADDVVLTNLDGAVTETTIANIAVRIEGTWWTPPVDDGCLPGVEREALLEQGAIRERTIPASALRTAEGVARFNAVRGWEPLRLH